MQDRFKFRMWNKLSNEMKDVISINYNPDFPECSTVVAETNSFDKVKTHTMPITCANSFNNIILMQCTGLKDKNGELIYEGDIVSVKVEIQNFFGDDEYYSENYKGEIIFEKGEIVIDVIDTTKHPISLYYHAKDCEVIGNVYETSELLKDGE